VSSATSLSLVVRHEQEQESCGERGTLSSRFSSRWQKRSWSATEPSLDSNGGEEYCVLLLCFMPRPNWFFGFPLDGAFVGELTDVPTSLRRYHPDDIHLTLSFLGGCGQEGAERALAALDARLESAPVPAIDATLGEVVPMGGSRRDYSALSALLDRGRTEATACIADVRDALTLAATGRREKRPPKPHVTIARPRRGATDEARAAALAWAAALDLSSVRARLDRIALFTWSDDRRERLFRIVTDRRLGGQK
jgi:2'-5' RNA ligase